MAIKMEKEYIYSLPESQKEGFEQAIVEAMGSYRYQENYAPWWECNFCSSIRRVNEGNPHSSDCKGVAILEWLRNPM